MNIDDFLKPVKPSVVDSAPTAVYRLLNSDGVLLYVGVSRDVRQRIKQHRADEKKQHWVHTAVSVEIEVFTSRSEALVRELLVIETESPRYNRAGVDLHVLAEYKRQDALEEQLRVKATKTVRPQRLNFEVETPYDRAMKHFASIGRHPKRLLCLVVTDEKS